MLDMGPVGDLPKRPRLLFIVNLNIFDQMMKSISMSLLMNAG